MAFWNIEDELILDEGSEVLHNQFKDYCSWCWGHGYGDCDECKKYYRRLYNPIRIEELKQKRAEQPQDYEITIVPQSSMIDGKQNILGYHVSVLDKGCNVVFYTYAKTKHEASCILKENGYETI